MCMVHVVDVNLIWNPKFWFELTDQWEVDLSAHLHYHTTTIIFTNNHNTAAICWIPRLPELLEYKQVTVFDRGGVLQRMPREKHAQNISLWFIVVYWLGGEVNNCMYCYMWPSLGSDLHGTMKLTSIIYINFIELLTVMCLCVCVHWDLELQIAALTNLQLARHAPQSQIRSTTDGALTAGIQCLH